ncbi:hypothetical protein B0H19DRAFT_1055832 [Mycena capillaripes]|nr:hypothetical protein B0H19DRAFT_1055832 [Mycena capillaripes]
MFTNIQDKSHLMVESWLKSWTLKIGRQSRMAGMNIITVMVYGHYLKKRLLNIHTAVHPRLKPRKTHQLCRRIWESPALQKHSRREIGLCGRTRARWSGEKSVEKLLVLRAEAAEHASLLCPLWVCLGRLFDVLVAAPPMSHRLAGVERKMGMMGVELRQYEEEVVVVVVVGCDSEGVYWSPWEIGQQYLVFVLLAEERVFLQAELRVVSGAEETQTAVGFASSPQEFPEGVMVRIEKRLSRKSQEARVDFWEMVSESEGAFCFDSRRGE